MKEIQYCTRCAMPSMRPRVTFNEEGLCSACQWEDIKKTLDWFKREALLQELIEKHRGHGPFDCLVPVSGGKDSTYVAHTLKEKYGLKPLTMTIRPDLALDIGEKNLERFINHGYDNIKISPNPDVVRAINRTGLVEQGRPIIGWQMAVQAAIYRTAVLFGTSLIMYGEDGETEYGGTSTFRDKYVFGLDELTTLLENNSWEAYRDQFSDRDLYWLQFPSKEEATKLDLCYSHWSYFENWDSERHGQLAIDRYGLVGVEGRNTGTFLRFAQNDTALYSLHVYLMYLKFGFGRCTQDACIEIRKGRMSREEGISLIKQYDHEFPQQHLEKFLEYFSLSEAEFFDILKKNLNTDLFVWKDNQPVRLFEPA